MLGHKRMRKFRKENEEKWFALHFKKTWNLSDEIKRAGAQPGWGSFYPPGAVVSRGHRQMARASRSLSLCPTAYHAGCLPLK